MRDEHVPTHNDMIKNYYAQKNYYEERFKQAVGIIIVLVVSFVVVRLVFDGESSTDQGI